MHDIFDLDTFPLHAPDTERYQALVARCRTDLDRDGMFNLHGLLRPELAAQSADALADRFENEAFSHTRSHNIYFKKTVPGLPDDHPALRQFETSNHTLCADQISDSIVLDVYQWQPLRVFLALVMNKEVLHLMADPLARVNVMSYGQGQALNWHFDRSEFTTTLLLRAPETGGEFEYRKDLRSADDPNYEGVAQLLNGADPGVRQITLAAGTLNVFKGKNTAHRVTPVGAGQDRVIAVFSYFEQPDVVFTPQDRIGFYGRAE